MGQQVFDKVLVSYPKSGRSWLWSLACYSIAFKQGINISLVNPRFKINEIPFASSSHGFPSEDKIQKAKSLCLLTRNPLDIITSCFYWREETNWEKHIAREAIAIKTWRVAWENQSFETIMVYEELPHSIAYFLSWLEIDWDGESIRYAKKASSFEKMHKQNPVRFRKGIVGDWRNHFTEKQNAS